jgi:hypothetical protein
VAETLFIAVVLLAGFVVVFAMDAHGKARAFEHGRIDSTDHVPPEAATSVDLPPPHFNQRDQKQRRRESS